MSSSEGEGVRHGHSRVTKNGRSLVLTIPNFFDAFPRPPHAHLLLAQACKVHRWMRNRKLIPLGDQPPRFRSAAFCEEVLAKKADPSRFWA